MMTLHSGMNFSTISDLLRTGYTKMINIGVVKTVLRILLVVVLALGFGLAFERAEAAPLIKGLGGTSGFGTLAMGRNDDGSSDVIALGAGFPYGIKLFSGSYTNLYINNNGNITFKSPLGTYTPTPFPITNLPMLAPFWGDVDTRGGASDPSTNNVYFSTAIPGKFIVTWNYVGYYSGATNKLNAFQLILTDRNEIAQGDFDIEYRYEQLQWTTGSASGGSNGLDGTPAQMGYDAGDGKNFYRHPDSGTANILKLTDTSNVDEPGVWRFEVRGGTPNPVKTPNLVNVRLIETLNASNIDIDPASFQLAPYSVTSANGQTFVEWRFAAFPANVTKDLSFDVIFRNPLAGESRLLISKLELLYNDVNGNPVRTELGPEYVNVYPSIYQVTPATDKVSYGPNEVVQISSTMKNLSAFAGTAAVRLSILDSNNVLVSALGTTSAQTVAAGATGVFSGLNFSTGNTYVGNYKVQAELVDNAGTVVAFGSVPFVIAATSGQSAKATIATDKQLYNPFDTVRISDRITNLLTNATLDDARVITTVTNPNGSVRFTKTETLQQLTPSALKDYAYSLSLMSAAAGQYNAALTVTKPDGTPLAQASTQFSVASTADTGAGLVGTISATPAVANMGQTVNLAFNASNNGNGALANVPLTVSIVDPDKQQVIAEYPYATALPIGGTYNGNAKWVASGNTGATYVAVLNATVGSKTIALAQTTLTVLKLDIKQSLSNGSRVLVLVSCNDDEVDTPASDGTLPACVTQRSQAIDQVLTVLGVSHTIASNETAFKQGLRSGVYNTYWISGKEDKLHDDLASEIREAVFAGDGLILDGVHDQRNKTLDTVAGILYRGKHGETGLTVDFNSALFESQSLPSVGRALKLDIDGGVQQALFNGSKTNSDGPGIVTHTYGAGHAVLFAFDLVSSLQARSSWQQVAATGLQYVLSQPPAVFTPGTLLSVKTTIANQGPATDVNVKSVLPQGALLLGSNPTGSYDADGNAVTWIFNLTKDKGTDLFVTLRVPSTAGDYSLQTVISTVKDNVTNQYGDALVLPVRVTAAVQTSSDVVQALKALPLTRNQDQKQRDAAIAKVQSAMTYFTKNTVAGYEAAIGELVQAVDLLNGLTAVDMRVIRDGMDRILKETQWRWSQAPATTK